MKLDKMTHKDGARDISVIEEEHERFVTFQIANETFGVNALKVYEIIGMIEITHVPQSLYAIKGVINLRGTVVPVIDMRMKFGMGESEYSSTSVILVVELKERLIGMVVDSVSEVVEIPVASINDSPHYSSNVDADFIKSIGRLDDLLIIILDVDRILLSSEEQSNNK